MNAALLLLMTLGLISVLVTIWTKYRDFRAFQSRRLTWDTSLRMARRFVERYGSELEARDALEKVRTKIVLSPDALDHPDALKTLYEQVYSGRLNKEIGEVMIKIGGTPGLGKTVFLDQAMRTYFEIERSRLNSLSVISAAGLMSSVFQLAISSTKKSSLDNSTVVGMLVGKKINSDTKAYVFLSASAVVQATLSLFFPQQFLIAIMAVTFLLIGTKTGDRPRFSYFGKLGKMPRRMACNGKPAATMRACRGIRIRLREPSFLASLTQNRGLSPVFLSGKER